MPAVQNRIPNFGHRSSLHWLSMAKAKNLMVLDNKKSYIAANKVGYDSSSQFSREFKRYFGKSPSELMRELRTAQKSG